MRKLKHLPLDQWPKADVEAFAKVYEPGDIFDETAGPGAHLAEGTRRMIRTAYRRWLGFLAEHYPDDLLKPPADRITPDRVRAFIEHLAAEVRPTTVAIAVDNLYYAARLIAPDSRLAMAGLDQAPPCRLAQARGPLRPTGPALAHPRLRHRADGRGAYLAEQRP